MIRLCLFLSVAGLALIPACEPAKQVVDPAAEKETIQKLTTELVDAELRRDMEACLSYLEPEAVIHLEGTQRTRLQGPSIAIGTPFTRCTFTPQVP